MRFITIFHDAVDPAKVDHDISEKHAAFLKANTTRIVLAGGLRQNEPTPFCGALWIMDVKDRAAAVELVEQDPYTIAGLWKNYDVLFWNKPDFYGAVTL